jgi:hydrogenase nickel incorporation protein HypA/HybF
MSVMHEMSIAMSLIELATEEGARLQPSRIAALHVRIGVLSAVVPDALRFSFDLAAEGTRLEGARLEIEVVPAAVSCEACGRESPADAWSLQCPACGGAATVVGGRELELTAMEVCDDDAAADC